jgi:hypothetical protein
VLDDLQPDQVVERHQHAVVESSATGQDSALPHVEATVIEPVIDGSVALRSKRAERSLQKSYEHIPRNHFRRIVVEGNEQDDVIKRGQGLKAAAAHDGLS